MEAPVVSRAASLTSSTAPPSEVAKTDRQLDAETLRKFANMFKFSQNSTLRSSGFRVLNVIRVFNIVALTTNMAATWAMIVMTGMTNSFYFFDAASHFWIFCINLFLTFSEIQTRPFKSYFPRNWPVFAEDHGFVWLGLGMIAIGCDMLGNLNKVQFSVENLGLPIWRLVLAAGILSLTFGIINIAMSLIFRDGQNGITARMIRRDGQMATAKADPVDDYYSAHSASTRHVEPSSAVNRMTRMWKKTSPFGGNKKPEISKPIPHDHDDLEAGRPDSVQFVQRPPTAMHPALKHQTAYSVADMPRF